tara:strand:- start:873 stop:1493 length:621 start_codon:yes stop_codon:yes gene_type:complete
MEIRLLREIIISSVLFVTFLLVALLSQIIAPSTVDASIQINSSIESIAKAIDSTVSTNNLFELDPDDPNPKLFAMAKESNNFNDQSSGDYLESKPTTLTASGLKITDLIAGKGLEASAGQKVTVNYRGRLENGKEFDSSYGRAPFVFPLGAGQVIKGWDEGVAGMKVGGKRELVIPPDLGYGARGAGGVIPPNATLVFEVELLEVN